MSTRSGMARHWDEVAEGWVKAGYSNPILARHKRKVYVNLLDRWAVTRPRRALKTDLFAEALNEEEFLSCLAWQERVLGIDISGAVVSRARQCCHARGSGPHAWVTCDVQHLPFASSSFDFVLSDSTLDHLETGGAIETAIAELSRVLAPGGIMVLTIDNPHNLTYPPGWLVRLWMRLGFAPYYIGATLSRGRLREVLERVGLRLDEETTILHYPHPDAMVRGTESALRAMGRGALDGVAQGLFDRLERLERSRVRYLTGRYLAVRATRIPST